MANLIGAGDRRCTATTTRSPEQSTVVQRGVVVDDPASTGAAPTDWSRSDDLIGQESGDEVIAVFDSGFGGLNILEALVDLLPGEHFVYLGDSKRSPFGDREPAEVLAFSLEILAYLRTHYRLKLIVVACNTASAIALDALRANSDVPVVGVIDAAVRAIGQATSTRRVGVVGTVATIRSGVYQRRLAHETVTAIACPGLVQYVETGAIDHPSLLELMRHLLKPMSSAAVDTVLLACTHYPYLGAQFHEVLGDTVTLISSAEETAFEVRELLMRPGQVQSTQGAVHVLCTGPVEDFQRIGRRLFNGTLDSIEHIELGDLAEADHQWMTNQPAQPGSKKRQEYADDQAS